MSEVKCQLGGAEEEEVQQTVGVELEIRMSCFCCERPKLIFSPAALK